LSEILRVVVSRTHKVRRMNLNEQAGSKLKTPVAAASSLDAVTEVAI
jgi:hypothetical protein